MLVYVPTSYWRDTVGEALFAKYRIPGILREVMNLRDTAWQIIKSILINNEVSRRSKGKTDFWRRANSSGIPYSSRAPLSRYSVAAGTGQTAGYGQFQPQTLKNWRFVPAPRHVVPFISMPAVIIDVRFRLKLVINIYASDIYDCDHAFSPSFVSPFVLSCPSLL